MKALLPLLLAGQVTAEPLFKTRVSSERSADVQKDELYGISGYFQRLHAAAKPSPGGVGVSDDTTSHGDGTGLASLPAAAIGPVLKFDPSLFLKGADPDNEFSAVLEAELSVQAKHPVPSTTFSYVLCGPQATASAARDALKAATGEVHHTVAYASRIDDTACWNAQLTLSQYRAFISTIDLTSSPFFAAAPVPTMAKFGPSLLARAQNSEKREAGDADNRSPFVGETGEKAATFKDFGVSTRAFLDPSGPLSGIRIVLHNGVKSLREVTKWTRDGFGLKGDHTHAFSLLANAEGTDADVDSGQAHPVWAHARRAAATGECPSLLDIKVPSGGITGANLRVLLEKKKKQVRGPAEGAVGADGISDATAIHHDHCALLALAYLAAQPEVRIVDIPPHHVTKSKVEDKQVDKSNDEVLSIDAALQEVVMNKLKNKLGAQSTEKFIEEVQRMKGLSRRVAAAQILSSRKSENNTKSSPALKDIASAVALQSGNAANPTPYWDIGINGANQFVQICDTGFDDASCLLRDGPKQGLSGNLSHTLQIERTVYDESSFSIPIFNYALRKVVSYTAVLDDPDYFQDYEAGHGSHVAGIVVGDIFNTSEPIVFGDELGSEQCFDYVYVYFDGVFNASEVCDLLFCDSCTGAGLCDLTCDRVASNRTNAYTGMAPGAKVNAFDIGDAQGSLYVPDNYYFMFLDGLFAGSKFHSNSWGSAPPYNDYDYGTQSLDAFMYYNPEQLVLVAAGNEGGVPYGIYNQSDIDIMGGDMSIGSPAGAKNCLTVGAAETKETPDTVATFSSRGPYNDGRIKPDVCGPGDPVDSTRSSGEAGLATCGILTISGTSMATPALAGTAALLRQFITEGKHKQYSPYGFKFSNYSVTNPTAALIKAMLIGSTAQLLYGYNSTGSPVELSKFYGATTAKADTAAYPVGTPTVDFTQGFGHTRLENVVPLDFTFSTFLYEFNISAYANMSTTYVVTSAATKIDFTLAWTDPPGVVGCDQSYMNGSQTSCLVHDLDLQVYVSGVRKYSNFGGSTSGGMYAGTEDTLNNVEKVSLAVDDFEVGDEIAVVLQSHGLPFADFQSLALVITGNLDVFEPVPAPTTTAPSSLPSALPSAVPSSSPSIVPAPKPSPQPTSEPSIVPAPAPSAIPTGVPSSAPSLMPSTSPLPTSSTASRKPSPVPTVTQSPTSKPTLIPLPMPSAQPTPAPSMVPTHVPSPGPSPLPTVEPSMDPSPKPSSKPTGAPTMVPSLVPSPLPTVKPSMDPSPKPSSKTTEEPSLVPSLVPSAIPTGVPSSAPSLMPSTSPLPTSSTASRKPSPVPTMTQTPTSKPTLIPLPKPSAQPTPVPSVVPTPVPILAPSLSLHPTTVDNARFSTTLVLQASKDVNEAQKESLKGAIAQTIFGVSDDWYESTITEYDVTSTYFSSTMTYAWTVTFEVAASLAVANEDSVSDWAASVQTLLTSGDFATSASASTGVELLPTVATAQPNNLRHLPSPQPTKTSAPTTPEPTARDTVKVAVALGITSSSKLTSARANELKGTIATELGVNKNDLKGYTTSYTTSTARRAILQSVTSYDWSVSFTVEVSLATTDVFSAEALSAEINTELSSSTFQSNVMTDLGVVVTAVSASSDVVVTTPAPTPISTADEDSSSSVKAAGLSWWGILLIAVGGLLFVACSAAAVVLITRRSSNVSCGSFFLGRSNFQKFLSDNNEELNPLGEDYPATFGAGSVLSQHHEF